MNQTLEKKLSHKWEGLEGGVVLEMGKQIWKEGCGCAKGRFCVLWEDIPNPKACWDSAPAVETGISCDPGGSGLPGVKMHARGLSDRSADENHPGKHLLT